MTNFAYILQISTLFDVGCSFRSNLKTTIKQQLLHTCRRYHFKDSCSECSPFAICHTKRQLSGISGWRRTIVVTFQDQLVRFHPLPIFRTVTPLFPSNRHHRSNGDCLEGERENYQVCSVQYCVQVQQLCTVQCTHIRTDLIVLWIGFYLTGPISLCLDSFLCRYYFVSDYIVCMRSIVT